jgi:hypothetical protein
MIFRLTRIALTVGQDAAHLAPAGNAKHATCTFYFSPAILSSPSLMKRRLASNPLIIFNPKDILKMNNQ